MYTHRHRLGERIERRMRVLGLSPAALVRGSGLTPAAVERVLTDPDQAPHADVSDVGAWVGLNLNGGRSIPVKRFLRRAAIRKAKYLVRLVQGTSALEAQAVGPDTERRMIRATVRDLLADRPKIWQ